MTRFRHLVTFTRLHVLVCLICHTALPSCLDYNTRTRWSELFTASICYICYALQIIHRPYRSPPTHSASGLHHHAIFQQPACQPRQ